MIPEEEILAAKILIVDDQEVSNRLLTEMLRKAGYEHITCVCDPREAADTYDDLKPDVLILDLHMPYLDGFQVMTQLKELEGQDYLPILVLTQLDNRDLRYLALESGAKDFLNKPYDRVEVLVRVRNIIEVHMLHHRVQDQNRVLEEKIRKRTKELRDTQLEMVQRLARVSEYRDRETGMHIVRMSNYAAALATQVGLPKEEVDAILVASSLHDIGKIAIPDSILLKPAKLTPVEWEVMKTHVDIGARLLAGSDSRIMKMAREIVLTHHERWDGTGYPKGLKGEEIPVVGRICGLCDSFDALTNVRPYKDAYPFEEGVREIRKGSGIAFDPQVVECFMAILPEIGTIKEKYDKLKLEDVV